MYCIYLKESVDILIKMMYNVKLYKFNLNVVNIKFY